MITYVKGTYTCSGCGKKLDIAEKVTELPKCDNCGSQAYSREIKEKPNEFGKPR
ncbi:zinc ribbon-containing protein [Culicoidibacter larvae]|uniref:Zinc ribbon domain-containing protein n=1 Tax=Culicoidibacter larvae TaxID=2579976 RepID=A0A5R8Q8P8_9FIRM|nr:hypothetical protein [Culicoidibacter larvae]TLG71549.1 hypothetical protein FEZ08_10675 [Culicoidibacter larvae]